MTPLAPKSHNVSGGVTPHVTTLLEKERTE